MQSEIDQSQFEEECERALHVVFGILGIPKSFLDMDCTHGFLVRAARMFGCKPCVGQTNDPIVKSIARRYARLFVGEVHGQYELVTCANHIPSDVANRLADGGQLVVLAFPNGKGTEVNGLDLDVHRTSDLQTVWSHTIGLLPPQVRVYVK